MIIDLEQFIVRSQPRWQELEAVLGRLRQDPARRLSFSEAEDLYRLYVQASSDLLRLREAVPGTALAMQLESVVGEAYALIYESRSGRLRWRLKMFVREQFPRIFRRYGGAFRLAVLCTLVGVLFGSLLRLSYPEYKGDYLPFGHLQGDPSARVLAEEGRQTANDAATVTFATWLWVHNLKVSFLAAGLGVFCGVGTMVLLFANGVLLGAVVLDYVLAGEGIFVCGWLLPHGVPEIGAILIAGQAGLVLGQAILGYGDTRGIAERLAEVRSAFLILLGGTVVLLLWAGLVEAFISQWHEPVLPYFLKIGLGVSELALLVYYLRRSGGEADA